MKFVHSTGENYAIGFTVNITVFLVCRVLEAGINAASVHDLRHESSGGRWKDELRPVVEMVLCVLLITLMMMSGFIVLIHAISRPNKWAFRCRANVEGERVADRRVVGKLFQITGPATMKLLIVSMVRVLGTDSDLVLANRRCRLPAMVEIGNSQPASTLAPIRVGTCRLLSQACTWFSDGLEVSEFQTCACGCLEHLSLILAKSSAGMSVS